MPVPKLPIPDFSALRTIRVELGALAAPLLLDPKILIPSNLKQLPHMPEVKQRLWYLGQNGGGIGSLCNALPTTRTWQWREMLEKDGPWTISPSDLARACWYLEDPILYYLVGKGLATLFPELNTVPETRHYSHALSWTLRRHVAEIQLFRSRIHAIAIMGDPEAASMEREMAGLRTQTFVLLKQIEMHEDKNKGIPIS